MDQAGKDSFQLTDRSSGCHLEAPRSVQLSHRAISDVIYCVCVGVHAWICGRVNDFMIMI